MGPTRVSALLPCGCSFHCKQMPITVGCERLFVFIAKSVPIGQVSARPANTGSYERNEPESENPRLLESGNFCLISRFSQCGESFSHRGDAGPWERQCSTQTHSPAPLPQAGGLTAGCGGRCVPARSSSWRRSWTVPRATGNPSFPSGPAAQACRPAPDHISYWPEWRA